jgi:hypothetical protein
MGQGGRQTLEPGQESHQQTEETINSWFPQRNEIALQTFVFGFSQARIG